MSEHTGAWKISTTKTWLHIFRSSTEQPVCFHVFFFAFKIEHGADVLQKDREGKTATDYAKERREKLRLDRDFQTWEWRNNYISEVEKVLHRRFHMVKIEQ